VKSDKSIMPATVFLRLHDRTNNTDIRGQERIELNIT